MTTELYIKCFIACLIGNILHVLVKIMSLQKDHKVANLEFSVIKYLKDDAWALVTDVFASFCLVYVVDEILSIDSRLMDKIKIVFIFIGFSGSYVILQVMSVAKSNFRKAVDYKTTQADKANGTIDKPTPTK